MRSSTIIGFVGGGGIGYYLWQWIVLGDYRAVSASFIAIAVVGDCLDFFSARVRAAAGLSHDALEPSLPRFGACSGSC